MKAAAQAVSLVQRGRRIAAVLARTAITAIACSRSALRADEADRPLAPCTAPLSRGALSSAISSSTARSGVQNRRAQGEEGVEGPEAHRLSDAEELRLPVARRTAGCATLHHRSQYSFQVFGTSASFKPARSSMSCQTWIGSICCATGIAQTLFFPVLPLSSVTAAIALGKRGARTVSTTSETSSSTSS